MADPLTTEELYGRLRRHVLGKDDEQGGRALLFPEVPVGDRRADAMSFGLWASRGFPIQTYELKTNRRDWVSEMEDHGKADPAMEISDYFWLVTNPDVVEPGELPEKWGLLISQGRNRKLKVAVQAPKLREGEPPIPRDITAKIFRGIRSLHWEEASAIREEARQNTDPTGALGHEVKRREQAEKHSNRLSEAYSVFKRESGIDFLKWQPDHEELEVLGKLVKAIRGGPYTSEFDALRAMVKRDEERMVEARGLLKRARIVMDEMEEREWRRAGKDEDTKPEEGF